MYYLTRIDSPTVQTYRALNYPEKIRQLFISHSFSVIGVSVTTKLQIHRVDDE
jgi:hypothetical protein